MEHPARLTLGELCDSIAHMNKDEPTVHPTVQVATDAQLRKALWDGVTWLHQTAFDDSIPDELRQRAARLASMRERDLRKAGIEPWLDNAQHP